jgi:polyhydroxybutyrate depolymerase
MTRRLGHLLLLAALVSLAAPAAAEERVPGGTIRDRIRERMESRRLERAPQVSGSAKVEGAKPGTESIVIKGVTRTFLRYTPNAVLLSGKRAAVVFALHGGKGTAGQLQGYLGMNAVADREGFIVVYPQGDKNRWNDGRTVVANGGGEISVADDMAFLNGLADALVAQGVADPKRLYAMGLSNGGFMSLALACSDANRFAAFGAVISSMPRAAKDACKPARALNVVMINGTDDKLIRYDGSPGRFGIKGNLPPAEAAAHLAKLAGCTASADTALPDRDPKDQTTVSKRTWTGCGSGSIAFYTVKGGGHQAPATGNSKASNLLVDAFLGSRSRDIDTAETVWEFFKASAR